MKYGFLLILLLAFSCQKKSIFIPVEENTESRDTSVVLQKFEMDGYNKDTPSWNLKARQAYLYEEKKIVDLRELTLITRDSENASTITGDKAIYNENTEMMTIEGKVRVVSTNGRVLTTEKLIWEEKTQKLHTDSEVKIVFAEGDIIRGKGLVADQKLDKITIVEGKGWHPPEN